MLAKIFDILLRFRLNYVGILADIKQAFLTVEIFAEHQKFLRFLWVDTNDPSLERTIIFKILRVVFGITSSPFLLNGTIRHHFLNYEPAYPKFVEKVLEDLYVDDATSGANTITEGKKIYDLAKSILLEAGFDLRKWVTNNSTLQKYFNQKENLLFKNHSFEEKDDYTFLESQIKFVRNDLKRVLGVQCDTQNDELVFHFSSLIDLARSLETTKRNVLKISASFYDPLGLISPVTARVKTIFQLLCKDKLGWDEKVPLEIEVIWNEFLINLKNWN